MLLRKYMSLLGIGAAQIDLVLPKDTYKTDENIEGKYIIKGGTIEQQIKRIECELRMIYMTEGTEKIVDTSTKLISRQIQSEETYTVAFSIKLPSDLKVSTNALHYRFHTKLYF